MTTKNVTLEYIGRWLVSTSPDEFLQMVQRNESLADRLRPWKLLVSAAKTMANTDFSDEYLLDWLLSEHPQHGIIAFGHRDWYNRNIRELRQFIESL